MKLRDYQSLGLRLRLSNMVSDYRRTYVRDAFLARWPSLAKGRGFRGLLPS